MSFQTTRSSAPHLRPLYSRKLPSRVPWLMTLPHWSTIEMHLHSGLKDNVSDHSCWLITYSTNINIRCNSVKSSHTILILATSTTILHLSNFCSSPCYLWWNPVGIRWVAPSSTVWSRWRALPLWFWGVDRLSPSLVGFLGGLSTSP